MGRRPLPMLTGSDPPARPDWIRVRFRRDAAVVELESLV
jgi:hypothetical protein